MTDIRGSTIHGGRTPPTWSRRSRCTSCARSSGPRPQEGPLRPQDTGRARRRLVLDRAGRDRRHPRPERLGEVDARPPALDAPPPGRRLGARSSATTSSSDARAVRRLVNRVSVEASFFKKMSSAENLSYAARYYGMTAKQTRDKIPAILERVGFPQDRRDEPMENLSRGMQQKVALARALLTSPVVLLLDEPTTGLDPRSKLEVQDFIREIRTTHDSTILLCTHDLAEAETLAERVGILDRGRLLALEPADDLKRRYGCGDARGGVLRGHRAASSRRRGTRTTDGPGGVRMRALGQHHARGARRRRRRRRAQLLPHQALHLVGRRLVPLDRREHAHDRLHREGDRGYRAASSTSTRR